MRVSRESGRSLQRAFSTIKQKQNKTIRAFMARTHITHDDDDDDDDDDEEEAYAP